MTGFAVRLEELRQTIDQAAAASDGQRLFAAWRAVLGYFHEISAARPDPEPTSVEVEYQQLWDLARDAIVNLGGQAEPVMRTLERYEYRRFGPLLGVSDDGSAAAAIRQGALASPKCVALAERTPLVVGVAHDAERLGAIGEVVVGPDEYANIRLACMRRILSTTNTGTRANVRHFLPAPIIRVRPGAPLSAAVDQLKRAFASFRVTPAGKARKLTVFVRFDRGIPRARCRVALRQLQQAVASGKFADPRWHRLGLMIALPRGNRRTKHAVLDLDLANECKVAEVAVDGPIVGSAREAHGLLSYFEPAELREVIRRAAADGIPVRPREQVDPQTTARHVWTGLSVARNMGFELGKYGLVPMTFEEQTEVIVRIQRWFKSWCPAPVCYLDYPLVTKSDVYFGRSLTQGIRRWLKMVGELGVRVVLIDTAKKSEGRHLLKENAADERGFLSLAEVRRLNEFGENQRIKVLWAGGISLPQAFEFGRLGVFGIYITSAVAMPVPLGRKERRDPALIAKRLPTKQGVTRAKTLLEAGFLVERLIQDSARAEADTLAAAARDLIASLRRKDDIAKAESEAKLHVLAVQAWKKYLPPPV